MNCPNCGAHVGPEDAFCGECGQPAVNAAAAGRPKTDAARLRLQALATPVAFGVPRLQRRLPPRAESQSLHLVNLPCTYFDSNRPPHKQVKSG